MPASKVIRKQVGHQKSRELLMIRLIFLIVLTLFLIWILKPFFKKKDRDNKQDGFNSILNPEKTNFPQSSKVFIVITVLVLLALVIWILPKFGINFFALLRKIISIILSLRGSLPF